MPLDNQQKINVSILAFAALEEYEKAFADLEYAIQLDPTFVLVYINRGKMYRRLQQYDHALADYDRAIELDPQFAFAYGGRGLVYFIRQDYQCALQDFECALGLDPGRDWFRDMMNDASRRIQKRRWLSRAITRLLKPFGA